MSKKNDGLTRAEKKARNAQRAQRVSQHIETTTEVDSDGNTVETTTSKVVKTYATHEVETKPILDKSLPEVVEYFPGYNELCTHALELAESIYPDCTQNPKVVEIVRVLCEWGLNDAELRDGFVINIPNLLIRSSK